MDRFSFLKSLAVIVLSPKIISEIKTCNPSDYFVDHSRGYKWKRKSTYKDNMACSYEHEEYGQIMTLRTTDRFIKIQP